MFAGQRNDGFFVDLGAIFDLADIRPIQNLHLIPTPAAPSVDPLKTLNIHTIAIKVPISRLTRDGSVPSDPMNAKAVLGIWGGASRRKVQVRGDHGNGTKGSGPWVQVSRLGNPLFNEVIVPIGDKDRWNALDPIDDNELREVREPAGAREAPAGPLPGRVPEPRGVHRSTGPTSTRSCSPASRAGSSRGSRTSPGRSRRTCCG